MWFFKILFKLVFSRLPFKYSFWKKLGIFRHGKMDDINYSSKIFISHMQGMYSINSSKNPVILEIGPGDSIATAILANLYNAKKVYLIDTDFYARKDILFYKNFIRNLINKNLEIRIDPDSFDNFDQLKSLCNLEYLTEGVSSFKKINSESIDYIFSHSVMEHIRLADLRHLITEMNRVLKSNSGVISHNINYKDHLNGSLNNLRFSKEIWESNFFANSGFYTNRIPAVEMHRLFKSLGFKLYKENFGRWPKLPLLRKYIHKEFSSFSDTELMNVTSSFLAQKL